MLKHSAACFALKPHRLWRSEGENMLETGSCRLARNLGLQFLVWGHGMAGLMESGTDMIPI